MSEQTHQDSPASSQSQLQSYQGYENWKSWNQLFQPDADERATCAGELAGCKVVDGDVLEIGFGAGGFLAWAREQGARVSGIEVIPTLAAAARDQGIRLLPPEFEHVADAHAASF